MPFDFEFWQLLLIPVFFSLGWVAARIDIKQLVRESRALPESYFKGLNFLLNEQPDKAIEAFLEVVRVDPQTIELHFALGNLFRRRGEIERAIRMHQSLVERDGLPAALRLQALAELGHDFLKAGLLDRAEEAFVKLRGSERDAEAKKRLLEIYQAEKEWSKAIAIARELPEYVSQKELSHFYCELASSEMMQSRPDSAVQYLESALTAHRRAVRASALLGDLHAQAGRWGEAIEAWQRIEQQNPPYLALVSQRLMNAYEQLGRRDEGLQLLKGYLEQYPSLDLLDTVFKLVSEAQGPQAAQAMLKDELRRNPTLLGLDKLLEAQLAVAAPDKRGDLELIKNLINNHTRRLARYRCENCGFKARQFYWRCPACGGWETYPPRRAEEFDIVP
jgi:lipopolysaccharide biosynthesis regulator YciM